MEMDTKKYSECANKFKVDRHKEIFVDENLVKINGQNYWLLAVA
jgi:transposase-like protein